MYSLCRILWLNKRKVKLLHWVNLLLWNNMSRFMSDVFLTVHPPRKNYFVSPVGKTWAKHSFNIIGLESNALVRILRVLIYCVFFSECFPWMASLMACSNLSFIDPMHWACKIRVCWIYDVELWIHDASSSGSFIWGCLVLKYAYFLLCWNSDVVVLWMACIFEEL